MFINIGCFILLGIGNSFLIVLSQLAFPEFIVLLRRRSKKRPLSLKSSDNFFITESSSGLPVSPSSRNWLFEVSMLNLEVLS